MITCTQMTTEENSSDGMTSVSTAPLVVEHMPLTISQLTDNSQPEGVIASDGVLTIAVDTNNSVLQESFSGSDQDLKEEPPSKRTRYDTGNGELSQDQSIKSLLFTINKAICMRLDGIENSIEILNGRTKFLEEKLEELIGHVKENSATDHNTTQTTPNVGSIVQAQTKGAVLVGLSQGAKVESQNPMNGIGGVESLQNMGLGPNVTLITLNSEEDFPHGTWLGDETNPEMRVRVPITPSDLLHIHSNCRTPEKMALTMLDYLFDRETQATSNLSGMGKYGKKQLDPLMIYGIRCHLIHRFNITESDWHRIKQNVDSKCRTAFRRKQRGMPLTVKAFRGKATPTYVQMNPADNSLSDEDSMQDSELHINQDQDLKHTVAAMTGDGLPPGEIQILHATPEQISQLQQAHHIQILQGDQVIQMPVGVPLSQDDAQNMQVSVSMPQPTSVQVATVTTDSGEVLQIQQS
ncbi:protein BANP-like isoform X2 [Saccostrea echinata]|uniref:protein BANP-like isoform X2 n=1 Tax=Saccostrea echinata TaxID=191078 RepID=UPI002A80B623|nr:protein BANP-like isoform X2 [Saccostrea echinata]